MTYLFPQDLVLREPSLRLALIGYETVIANRSTKLSTQSSGEHANTLRVVTSYMYSESAQVQNSMRGVSVIICCHNSAYRIVETLRQLWCQETKEVPYEVILVDNNCTDNTVEIATNEWRNHGRETSFRVVEESVPGLSAARQKGIKEAKFEYIVLCDDDNWLAPDYLRIAFDTMESNPEAGVLGGSSTANSTVAFPEWFEEVKGDYAVGLQSDSPSCDVSERGYVWGAGMVLRKSVFEKIIRHGIASVLTDRRGNELSRGGDSEICKWFLILRYSLWYRADLKFVHFLESDRLSKEYYSKMKEKQAESYLPLWLYDYLLNFLDLSLPKKTLTYIKALTRMALNLNLSVLDETTLCLLYGRRPSHNKMYVITVEKIVRNVSLLLRLR